MSARGLDGLAHIAVLLERDVGASCIAETEECLRILRAPRLAEVACDKPPHIFGKRDPEIRRARPSAPLILRGKSNLDSSHHGGDIKALLLLLLGSELDKDTAHGLRRRLLRNSRRHRPRAAGTAPGGARAVSLLLAEHTHIPASRETPWPNGGELPRKYARTYDLFVAVTAAAVVTTRLRVGSGICLVSQRDPIITAKAVASIDHLSGGRLDFGVGAGWNIEEMRHHGTDPRTRMALSTPQASR